MKESENFEKKNIEDEKKKITDELKESKEPIKKIQEQKNKNAEVRTPAIFVPLNRKPEIQAARLKLPVVAEEQLIVETINDNPIVIITGETGSGE